MDSQKVVTPAKAGVQERCNVPKILDSGLRRNDGKVEIATFYEIIMVDLGIESFLNLNRSVVERQERTSLKDFVLA